MWDGSMLEESAPKQLCTEVLAACSASIDLPRTVSEASQFLAAQLYGPRSQRYIVTAPGREPAPCMRAAKSNVSLTVS